MSIDQTNEEMPGNLRFEHHEQRPRGAPVPALRQATRQGTDQADHRFLLEMTSS
jgi:hypothetical protein